MGVGRGCDTQNRLGTVLALALSSERSASSTAAVLNENGVVIDHAILGQGGPVSSASIGSVSVSYGGASGGVDLSQKGQAKELYRCASLYLDIYRGCGG